VDQRFVKVQHKRQFLAVLLCWRQERRLVVWFPRYFDFLLFLQLEELLFLQGRSWFFLFWYFTQQTILHRGVEFLFHWLTGSDLNEVVWFIRYPYHLIEWRLALFEHFFVEVRPCSLRQLKWKLSISVFAFARTVVIAPQCLSYSVDGFWKESFRVWDAQTFIFIYQLQYRLYFLQNRMFKWFRVFNLLWSYQFQVFKHFEVVLIQVL